MRIVRVSLALAVAFWMAGAGCMVGCENMVMAAAPSEAASPASSPGIVVTGEACASMQSHDCCAKRGAHSAPKADHPKSVGQGNTKTTSSLALALTATFPTMMDCPLAVNATAVLSKAEPDDSNVALPSSSEGASLSNSAQQITALGRPLRLPNRGHTYLRCCVFLI